MVAGVDLVAQARRQDEVVLAVVDQRALEAHRDVGEAAVSATSGLPGPEADPAVFGRDERDAIGDRDARLHRDVPAEPRCGRDQEEHPGPVVGEREDGVHATRAMARCGRPGNAASRLLTSRSFSGGTPPPTSASSIDRAHLGKVATR